MDPPLDTRVESKVAISLSIDRHCKEIDLAREQDDGGPRDKSTVRT
jgi:hypothetical protein